jgi:hypothetical protein
LDPDLRLVVFARAVHDGEEVIVILYGLVNSQSEKLVQFFPSREDAEEALRQARESEPALAQSLAIVEVELEHSLN